MHIYVAIDCLRRNNVEETIWGEQKQQLVKISLNVWRHSLRLIWKSEINEWNWLNNAKKTIEKYFLQRSLWRVGLMVWQFGPSLSSLEMKFQNNDSNIYSLSWIFKFQFDKRGFPTVTNQTLTFHVLELLQGAWKNILEV